MKILAIAALILSLVASFLTGYAVVASRDYSIARKVIEIGEPVNQAVTSVGDHAGDKL